MGRFRRTVANTVRAEIKTMAGRATIPALIDIITGIGIDLVEVERIPRMLVDHGERFKARTFTEGESAYCDLAADPAIHYAARFATKEAAAKAISAWR